MEQLSMLVQVVTATVAGVLVSFIVWGFNSIRAKRSRLVKSKVLFVEDHMGIVINGGAVHVSTLACECMNRSKKPVKKINIKAFCEQTSEELPVYYSAINETPVLASELLIIPPKTEFSLVIPYHPYDPQRQTLVDEDGKCMRYGILKLEWIKNVKGIHLEVEFDGKKKNKHWTVKQQLELLSKVEMTTYQTTNKRAS
ncbi:hypothetical protein L2735_11475 [Shewanella olleyana]|uniref:hypothetical protein n=1 Tax=Shewanella olleyana TaxID=135626 RepID=UPI00200DD967|nr:hypothetical protein [Shewanella olleyana]MCL1067424.1 hypothetical protein [Shewanella olleyana]